MKKYDYTGKSVFIGIDVHKKTYNVAAVADGVLVKRNRLSASPDKLLAYLNKFFSGATIYSAYEAGFSGFVLHRFLVENNVNNIVVHAASVEVSARDRVKTDKRDSIKIATQLSVGRLSCIPIPTSEREDFRELTRLRDSLRKKRTRAASQIKSRANLHGLLGPDDTRVVSEIFIKQLTENFYRVGPNAVIFFKSLINEWRRHTDEIKEVDHLIEEQAKIDSDIDRVYQSAPGIGATAARILANELGDMSNFSSEQALFSYTGFTPSEYSSGEHKHQGHISRQGKPQLRRILIQSAWIAIRNDKDLNDIYLRISKKSGKKKAIVGIARRLIGRIRSCFVNECLYHPHSKPEKKQSAA